jgi:DNA-binding transcriptional LysR family regulator
MSHVRLEALRVFAAVAETGTLAQAALRLGRTPAALSMTLKQLEADLGGALFEGERKSRLTAFGRFALDEARRVLSTFDESLSAMSRFARAEDALVRLASVPSVANRILPEVIARYRATRPRGRVELRDMDSEAVAATLLRGEIDLGFGSLPAPHPDIASEPLMEDQFGVVCRPDHPLAGLGRPLEWEDLEGHDFLANGLIRQLSAPALEQTAAQANLLVYNTSSLLAFVRQGFGITLLPKLAVPSDPDFCFLELEDKRARRRLFVIKRAEASLTPGAAAFEALLKESLVSLPLSQSLRA